MAELFETSSWGIQKGLSLHITYVLIMAQNLYSEYIETSF